MCLKDVLSCIFGSRVFMMVLHICSADQFKQAAMLRPVVMCVFVRDPAWWPAEYKHSSDSSEAQQNCTQCAYCAHFQHTLDGYSFYYLLKASKQDSNHTFYLINVFLFKLCIDSCCIKDNFKAITSVRQPCRLESYDLDSRQTQVLNLITFDFTWQNEKKTCSSTLTLMPQSF